MSVAICAQAGDLNRDIVVGREAAAAYAQIAMEGEATGIDAAWCGMTPGKRADSHTKFSLLTQPQKDTLVNKINYDTLKLSSHELDQIRDDEGYTARRRLEERLELHEEDADRHPLGKIFYGELRTQFRSSDSPQKKLMEVGKGLDDDLNADLVEAMKEYTSKGIREPLISYLALADTLTRAEFVGVGCFALGLKPSAGIDQLKACCAVAASLVRLKARELYPNEYVLLLPWLDGVLCKVHKGKKGKAAWPKNFCRLHVDLVASVFPQQALDTVIQHDGPFKPIESELLECTQTEIGTRLFGPCLSNIVNETVTGQLKEFLILILIILILIY